MSRFKLVAVVSALMLLLAGCAQLPRSGEIKIGPDLKSGLTSDYLYYSPSGPNPGDDQQQIINGFLNAATGPQNDYQIAREYLTTEYSSKWSPNDEVLIQESRPELTMKGESSAQLKVKAVAQIDNVGLWTSLPGGQVRTLDFKLVKESGQWRISAAPNATVLVKPVFDVLFKSYSLFFYDGENKYLVPDLRWFSSRVSTGTRLVNALLAGPNKWLASTVNNSFPIGTKLALDAVTVESGTAVVDLNTSATKADKAQRSRMLGQLTATLNQLNNVFSVKVQIDHTPQQIALQNTQLPYPNGYTPMVLDANGMREVGQAVQRDKASTTAIKLSANEFGYSPDGNYLALRSSHGVDLVKVNILSSALTTIDARPGLLAPVIDNRNQTWTLPSKASEPLLVHDLTGHQVLSTSGWLSKGERLAFGISREGARIAVLMKVPGSTVVYVSAIKRDAQGNPVALLSPRRVALGTNNLQSLSWSGLNTLTTVAKVNDGLDTPITIYVGGGSTELAGIGGLVSAFAQQDSNSTFALDSNGLLYEYRGLSWSALETGITAAHFTGN
jgi:Lipoprotein LpqB beta-propeller domain/Sporulation and spore germination